MFSNGVRGHPEVPASKELVRQQLDIIQEQIDAAVADTILGFDCQYFNGAILKLYDVLIKLEQRDGADQETGSLRDRALEMSGAVLRGSYAEVDMFNRQARSYK